MSRSYLQVDDLTGVPKRVAALFVEDKFTTGNTTTTDFVLTNGTLTASNLVDFYENGVLLEETADYSRNVGSNKLVRNSAAPQNARIRIRVWS